MELKMVMMSKRSQVPFSAKASGIVESKVSMGKYGTDGDVAVRFCHSANRI